LNLVRILVRQPDHAGEIDADHVGQGSVLHDRG
jgi:hypothetical protein